MTITSKNSQIQIKNFQYKNSSRNYNDDDGDNDETVVTER